MIGNTLAQHVQHCTPQGFCSSEPTGLVPPCDPEDEAWVTPCYSDGTPEPKPTFIFDLGGSQTFNGVGQTFDNNEVTNKFKLWWR